MVVSRPPVKEVSSTSMSMMKSKLMQPCRGATEPIYVDEKAGSDGPEAQGNSTSPYLTILHAILTSFPSPTAVMDRPILIRKPDSPEVNDWQPISGAALKKNKKFVDAHWKKVKKAEENREAVEKDEREKGERDAKRREEASKIVLVEDTSLPVAPKVSPRRMSRVCRVDPL